MCMYLSFLKFFQTFFTPHSQKALVSPQLESHRASMNTSVRLVNLGHENNKHSCLSVFLTECTSFDLTTVRRWSVKCCLVLMEKNRVTSLLTSHTSSIQVI